MTGPGPVDPFGPEAGRRLAGAADLLEASVTPFIDAFYEDLGDEPGPSAVLARLSPREIAHLKERQAEHLMRLVDPALTAEEVAERGRRVGRIHAMVGVELDWYAAAHTAYHRGCWDCSARAVTTPTRSRSTRCWASGSCTTSRGS